MVEILDIDAENSTNIPVEIKYSLSLKLTQSGVFAINEVKPRKSWVVYPDSESYPLREDVWTLPVGQIGRIFE